MYGYDSRVRLSEVDQDRRMTLNAILNSFQDCHSFHSEDSGSGSAFVEQKKADVGLKFLEDSDSEISGTGRVHSG